MNYFTIIEKSEEYVKAYMHQHKNLNLYYHNIIHTEKVVEAAKQIAFHYKLRDKDIFITVIACWFHDIGHFETIVNHEQAGALKAEAFLKSYDIDEETINAVKKCILATRLPQAPGNLLEQIICDADLFHLGTEDFMKQSKLVKKEIEAVLNLQINETEWWNTTIRFIESHHYHTNYCKNLLNNKKTQNLEKLKKKVEEHCINHCKKTKIIKAQKREFA